MNGFVNLARLNLTSNFIASLILPLWARSNLTVKIEHKFEVRVKAILQMGSNLTKRRLNLSGKVFKFSQHSGAKLKNQPLVILFYEHILGVRFRHGRDLRIYLR